MPKRGREIWYALAAIATVTALYVLAYVQEDAFPTAASLVGHGIGIAGFVLMLMTATLYSLRKLRVDARWGATSSWLRFHMVTGLVGPYMVLLHTAWRFQGLAGLTTVLTVVVVASGVVGRFIYTAIPRTLEDAGAGAGASDLARPPREARGAAPGAGRLAHRPRAPHVGAVRCRLRPRRRGALLCDAAAMT